MDSDPPQVTAVRGNTTRDAIEVVFNEPIAAASASLLANYSVSPALGLLSAETGDQRVILRTAAQTAGANHTVTIRNVRDQRGNALDVAEASFQAGTSGLFLGLEGYWTFDKGTGAVARDLSGFGRDAGVSQVPAYAGQTIR